MSRILIVLTVFMTVITVLMVLVITLALVSQSSDLSASRRERKALADEKEKSEKAPSEEDGAAASAAESSPAESGSAEPHSFEDKMREINPDYICWLKIEGTLIDYPVVRGDDNEKYLNRSFYGKENMYGAVFMDYRCAGGDAPHLIVFGHNTADGDMFGGLRRFLNREYLQAHPVISLAIDNRSYEYEIFSARKTDVSDPAYNLYFDTPGSFSAFAEECGAPNGAKQILTLSTCVSGNDEDERVIVQGAIVAQ